MGDISFNRQRLVMIAGIAMLLLGVAAWHRDRLSEICGVLALPASAAASPASNMSSPLADDKVIRMEAYCYDEGRRRICYVQ